MSTSLPRNVEGWSILPEEILEEILSFLPLRYRYYASQVCQNWSEIFWNKNSWSTFVFKDRVFTRPKFTLHAGYQYMLDYYRLRFLVNKVVWRWNSIIFKPVTLFFNLYEFMRALTNYAEYHARGSAANPFQLLSHFEFNWQLKFQTSTGGPTIYGTGGHILKGIAAFIP